jgi:hypothetical protein
LYTVRNRAGLSGVENPNELEGRLHSMLCTTRQDFEARLARDPDQMMVLNYDMVNFTKTIVVGGQRITTSERNFAFVYSSPGLLLNIKAAIIGKPGALNVMMDGTHKVCNNGWVLTGFGTTTVYYDKVKKKTRQSFVPFFYLISPTESSEAAALALKTGIKVTKVLLGEESLPVRFVQIDHSEAFAKAVREVEWDQPYGVPKILTCFPHCKPETQKYHGTSHLQHPATAAAD